MMGYSCSGLGCRAVGEQREKKQQKRRRGRKQSRERSLVALPLPIHCCFVSPSRSLSYRLLTIVSSEHLSSIRIALLSPLFALRSRPASLS